MPSVCVVGVGLIGGSLGMALRRRSYRVVGLGRSTARLARARARGAIDEGFTDARRALSGADIVVFCTPVQSIVPLAAKLLPHVKKGAVLTDAGSVKGEIHAGMARLLARRRDVSFVGSHPMAGSEQTGVENARRDLFRGAVCAVTGPAAARGRASVWRMWSDAGARCIGIDPRTHDELLAVTSHLPHILAFALFSQVSAAARRDTRVRRLTAGSFADLTRVAGSDPELWTGVLALNRKAVLAAVARFGSLANRIVRMRPAALRRVLDRISKGRKAWSA